MSAPATVEDLRAPAEAPRRSSFRPDIEGLRAIAVLVVVFYHYRLAPFSGGYVGVDVFFVISGFIITRMLLAERGRSGKTSLGEFYARRIRRILPAATLVLIATTIVAFYAAGSVVGQRTASDARAAALFYSNIHFAQSGLDYLQALASPSPLIHFWSLSIEEQFYFVWPSIFVVVSTLVGARQFRRGLGGFLVACWAASTVASIVLTASNQQSAYYSSFARAGELALGAFVAVAEPKLQRLSSKNAAPIAWFGVAGIFASAIFFTNQLAFPGAWVLIPTMATAIVIAVGSVTPSTSAGRLLGMRSMLWLGALSYSLYLWHWPVFALYQDHLGRVPALQVRLVLLVVAVVLAVLCSRLVERPVRASTWLKAHRIATFVLGAILIASTLGFSVIADARLGRSATFSGPISAPRDFVEIQQQLRTASLLMSMPPTANPVQTLTTEEAYNKGCLVQFFATTSIGNRPGDCFFGPPAAKRTVILYGDSNAAMWIPAFVKLGWKFNFRIELVARASCEIADIQMLNQATLAPGVGCWKFHSWALAHIAASKPTAVIIADIESSQKLTYSGRPIPLNTYQAAFTRTIAAIVSTGSPAYVMGTPAYPLADPALCLSTHSSDIQKCATPRGIADYRARSAISQAATIAAGGKFVSVMWWFCGPTTCPPVSNHMILYYDQFHVTKTYIGSLVYVLHNRLRAAGFPFLETPLSR